MKTFTSLSLRFILFAIAFLAIPAHALTLQSPSCTASTITQFQPGYVSCLGSAVGNIDKQLNVQNGVINFDHQLTGSFAPGLKQGNGFSLVHVSYFGPVTPVPEPKSYAMILAGLLSLRLLAAERLSNHNKLS